MVPGATAFVSTAVATSFTLLTLQSGQRWGLRGDLYALKEPLDRSEGCDCGWGVGTLVWGLLCAVVGALLRGCCNVRATQVAGTVPENVVPETPERVLPQPEPRPGASNLADEAAAQLALLRRRRE